MVASRDEKLFASFAEHAGVVTLPELLRFGFSRSSVQRMVARKALVTLHPGVYQSSHHPTDELQRQIAVCLSNRLVLIGFLTAGRWWEMRSLPADHLLHVLVPHALRPEIAGAVIHRCRRIDPVDIVQLSNGMRITSPARTLFDIADAIGDVAAASILEQLINNGMGSFATHVDTVARLGQAQRPGTMTMRRVMKSRTKWSKAMQSGLETRVLDEIRRQGLPEPVTQHTIHLEGGKTIHVDFGWPERRVALEVDHPFWHSGEDQTHSDNWRDRKAGTVGWVTHRVTSLDVDRGLREAIADIGKILGLATSVRP